MNNVKELNDAGVVQLSQETDFSQGSRGNALVAVLNFDFFESDNLNNMVKNLYGIIPCWL